MPEPSMKENWLFTLLVPAVFLFSACQISETGGNRINSGSYEPNWASLDSRPTPDWYKRARFGVFVQWGVASVPAYAPAGQGEYAEWYWKRLRDENDSSAGPTQAYHNRMFGPDVSYADLASQFEARQFSARKWAKLFKQSGAKYVVFDAKHHDGYAMWPSKYSWNWNAKDVGPEKDLVGSLTEAVREQGLRMGLYYSLYDWFHPLYQSDVDRYVDRYMIPQMKELVRMYEPHLLWVDGEWDHDSETWRSKQFLTWLFNESPVRGEIAVNDRWGKESRNTHGGFFTSEYGSDGEKRFSSSSKDVHIWEEIRGISDSFGYNRMEEAEHYLSTGELIKLLVRTVSKGGNLLLSIGPRSDGLIPPIMEERLIEMGRWLEVNGEAIYGSHRWPGPGAEHEDIRFTRKENTGYVHLLSWPGDELVLKHVSVQENSTVTFLGRSSELSWNKTDTGIRINIPDITIDDLPSRHVQVLKIEGLR